MRPVRSRDIVPEMERRETCLFRRSSASEGVGVGEARVMNVESADMG